MIHGCDFFLFYYFSAFDLVVLPFSSAYNYECTLVEMLTSQVLCRSILFRSIELLFHFGYKTDAPWLWFSSFYPPPPSVLQALGDYTNMISDFSVFPSEPKGGRSGSYWYHEDTQAFFDDLDHYKMILAMCRLSCPVCDKMDGPAGDGVKRRARLRNIDQLKGHLFHQHRLLMCSLCLEGRKVSFCNIWFSFHLLLFLI